jgi:predicted alpha/beta superfamily hydrolase
LPSGYSEQEKEYPVLYQLDGEDFQPGEILEFSEDDDLNKSIPDLIYVSIANTVRERDFSPVITSFCENPGADDFINFLGEELIPFIDHNYRSSKYRILCGKSFSSVFTLYCLLEKPSLFCGYLTSSLYFPQCKEFFMETAEVSFSQRNYEGRSLFISRGGLDHRYNKDNLTALAIDKLIAIIEKNNLVGFRWDYRVYEDYGHCPEPSYRDGLNWMFNKK